MDVSVLADSELSLYLTILAPPFYQDIITKHLGVSYAKAPTPHVTSARIGKLLAR
jgi:hypothetical protein